MLFFAFLQQNVYVVSHKAISIYSISTFILVVFQRFKKSFPIFIIFKNLLTVNPSKHNMVNSAATFLPRLSWHIVSPILILSQAYSAVKSKGTREPSPCPPTLSRSYPLPGCPPGSAGWQNRRYIPTHKTVPCATALVGIQGCCANQPHFLEKQLLTPPVKKVYNQYILPIYNEKDYLFSIVLLCFFARLF